MSTVSVGKHGANVQDATAALKHLKSDVCKVNN